MQISTNIQKIVGITENAHNNLIIDSGVAYLETQRAWTPRGREKLMQSRLFWHWWWKNWLAVDEAMLGNRLASMAVKEYLQHHCRAHAYEMPTVAIKMSLLDKDIRMKRQPSKVRTR